MKSSTSIHDVLNSLAERMKEDATGKYRFSSGVDMKRMELIETAYGISLPSSYRQFLEQYDGGMITEDPASYYCDMTEEEPDGPIDTSNSFFSLSKMHDEYENLYLNDALVDEEFEGIYPVIPIGQSIDKRIFFTLSQIPNTSEPPIFIGNMEHKSCKLVSHDFAAFLSLYVKHSGFPVLPLEKSEDECYSYIKEHIEKQDKKEFENPEKGIERCNALIELFPDEAWHYNLRGLYSQELDKTDKALSDFDHAVELEGENAYYRYCRGYFYLLEGKPKRALLDLDLAVRLEMDDPLYRYARALALFELSHTSKALLDCHMILDQDPNTPLGLSLRESLDAAMKTKEREMSAKREQENKKS